MKKSNTPMDVEGIDVADIGAEDIGPGLAPAYSVIPAPIFDQIEISIWRWHDGKDIVLPKFKKHFGRPQYTNDRKALHWPSYRITMSKCRKSKDGTVCPYRVIRFPATENALAAINPILKLFPCRPDGKPAAQLRSAEVAWDFLTDYVKYGEPANQLTALAAAAILKNPKAKFRLWYSPCLGLPYSICCYDDCPYLRRCRCCSDGASNGLLTIYFRSLGEYLVEDEDAESYFAWQPTKKSIFWGKIYCKKLAPKKPWRIRFEVTLLGPKLEKFIGKALPDDLTTLPNRLAGIRFDDFWHFAKFDWSAFMEAARRSADYKGIPFADIETRANFLSLGFSKLDGISVTMRQIRFAKTIAKRLSGSLKTRVGGKEFRKPLTLEEVLSENPSSYPPY